MPASQDASATYKHRVVVLTAIRAEYEAVRAHLYDIREERHPQGTVYERALFSEGGTAWDVLLVQTGQNNQSAALETERAIQYFMPRVALFVGVAGGLKDAGVGDVVAASKVYGYESGKARLTFEPRTEMGLSSYALVQRASAEAKLGRWRARIKGEVPRSVPRVFVGPIVAGEKVVADTRAAVYRFVKECYSDALAVEMEGLGFLLAIHANQRIDALVVRGISDCIDDKAQVEQAGSQEQAARHASAFALEVLARFASQRQVDTQQHRTWARSPPGKLGYRTLLIPVVALGLFLGGGALVYAVKKPGQPTPSFPADAPHDARELSKAELAQRDEFLNKAIKALAKAYEQGDPRLASGYFAGPALTSLQDSISHLRATRGSLKKVSPGSGSVSSGGVQDGFVYVLACTEWLGVEYSDGTSEGYVDQSLRRIEPSSLEPQLIVMARADDGDDRIVEIRYAPPESGTYCYGFPRREEPPVEVNTAYPACTTDRHCTEKGEVCVGGTCQECGTDSDCREGFSCKLNLCKPTPPECNLDSTCGSGRICEGGKCLVGER